MTDNSLTQAQRETLRYLVQDAALLTDEEREAIRAALQELFRLSGERTRLENMRNRVLAALVTEEGP